MPQIMITFFRTLFGMRLSAKPGIPLLCYYLNDFNSQRLARFPDRFDS